jgi:Na+/proline symporter
MAKFFTVLFGLFLIVIAFFARDTQQVLILGLKIGTFTYGALLGIFLLGVLTRRGNDFGNTLSMGVSIITILFIEFYTDVAWIWYVLIGTAITFFVGALFPSGTDYSSPHIAPSGKREEKKSD